MSKHADPTAPNFTPEPFHFFALHLLLLGNTPRQVATQTNKPAYLIQGFAKSQWCQDQIKTYHERFMANVQKRVFDPHEKFWELLPEKVALLDEMTKSENPSVALRATELWLAHGIGSPVKRSEIKVDGTVAHLGLEELRFVKEHGRLPSPQEKLQLSAPSIESECAPID